MLEDTVRCFDKYERRRIDESLRRSIAVEKKRLGVIAEIERIAADYRAGEFDSIGKTPELVTAVLGGQRQFEKFRVTCRETLRAYKALRPSAQGLVDGVVSRQFKGVMLDSVLEAVVSCEMLGALQKADGTDWKLPGRGKPINWAKRAVAARVGVTLREAGVRVTCTRGGPWATAIGEVFQASGDRDADRDLMALMKSVIDDVNPQRTRRLALVR